MKRITQNNAVKAYKVFNSDWTCRDFQFEIGKTFKHSGDVEICSSGFHACLQVADCFSYYAFDPSNKVAEVLLWGSTDEKGDDTKICAGNILIVRELDWQEVLVLANSGSGCTGLKNSGNRNSGNRNSGNRNSGDGNSGDWNSGNRNSGDWNSGNWNSGNRNSGDWNSGNWNSGNRNSGNRNSGDGNSGDWNSGDGNKRFFCSGNQSVLIFDQPTDLPLGEIHNLMPSFWNYDTALWIDESKMSDEEKESHPHFETAGGYLKTFTYKEMCVNGWGQDDDRNKLKFFRLPNFNLEKFQDITGIDAKADYERLKDLF